MNFASLVLEQINKVSAKVEEDAAYSIALQWLKGGESVLSRDKDAKYIRLSDDMDHLLSVQYEDKVLKGYKFNKSSNIRIASKAKEIALSLLRNTDRYPLVRDHFGIKKLSF